MNPHSGAGALQERTRRVRAPAVSRLWDITLTGVHQLPDVGPAILCPNHISFIDSPFLACSLPRNISFLGKAEYMDSWTTKHIFPALGMIPIDRTGAERSAAGLEAAASVLRRGELFAMYPEGTRGRDATVHRGRTGAARLSLEIGCPIYPVGVVGTDAIQPPGRRTPRLRRSCSITIGRPVLPEHHRSPDGARSMIDEVMFEISQITGREFVDRHVPWTDRRASVAVVAPASRWRLSGRSVAATG